MRSVDEHSAVTLARIEPLAPLDLQLLDAAGSVLAEDVTSPVDLPAFDNSAMDGYAVRLVDVDTASRRTPATLPVVGDIAAGGSSAYVVQPGFTARIMTGAPVPVGAEAVVPVEWTDGGIATVTITQGPRAGQHIRRRGEDVRVGDRLLTAGTRLGPPQVGLLAAVGRARVRVRPRPRVVVLSTGSELVEPGTTAAPGQIFESNSYMLTAAVREAGAVAFRVGILPDDPRRLLDAIEDQLVRADLVVTTGGVSAGAYDIVKEVLSGLGTVEFPKVAMQPGMPQGFGTVGPDSIPIFTLPGNPVSAYVSFEVFVRPALRRMMGLKPLHRTRVRAMAGAPLRSVVGKRSYLRVRLETERGHRVVRPVGGQGSHLVGSLAVADALAVVPEETAEVPLGGTVSVMVLGGGVPGSGAPDDAVPDGVGRGR